MGCSSCGGASSSVSVTAGGVPQARSNEAPTRYVWRWISTDAVTSATFPSEEEARAWLKGNPGTLSVVPA